ncbi:MAG: signal peptidase II [Pseudomonadota bacterium]
MNAWLKDMRANPVFRFTMIGAVIAFLLDQATKLWVLHVIKLQDRFARHWELSPIFDLTYVENRGVSFGLFAGGMTSRVLLSLLAIVVSAFIIHWAGRLYRKAAAWGAGLIVGGALGNAIDRIFYGFVVDFLNFSDIYFPWQFNFADVAINIGVALLAYDAFFVAPKQESKNRS